MVKIKLINSNKGQAIAIAIAVAFFVIVAIVIICMTIPGFKENLLELIGATKGTSEKVVSNLSQNLTQ